MDLRDPTTFGRLFTEHNDAVTAAASRVGGDAAQAQDVAQDVFFRLWCRPELYDPARGELGALLRTMARNRALDLYRSGRSAGRAAERLSVLRALGGADDDPVLVGERRHDHHILRAAVKRLPPAQREAVVMAYWGDLRDPQVAQAAGVPLGTAKSRIRLGLRKVASDVGDLLAS
jgi:RNA polymerase sigma-70 factor (ECF subfamily)